MSLITGSLIKHQREYFDDDKTKIILLSGGFGSGKTRALVLKLLKLSMLNKDFPGGLLAPSIPELKKDVIPTFEEVLEENNIDYRYHKSDKWFQFPWSKGKLYCFTAEKRLRGPNLAYFGINESSLVSYERFKEALGRVRLRNAPCSQIVLCQTPEGMSHWSYDHFVENPRPECRVIFADTRKNPYLDPKYITMLEQNYDKLMLDAYLEGHFVNMNSNQFYYSFNRKEHVRDTVSRDKAQPVHVAMDFNVDHMCASLWNVKGTKHVCFDEIHIPNDADTNKMCELIHEKGCLPENSILYPDPAGDARSTKGHSDVQILRNNGYYDIRFKKKAPPFRRRQLCVNNLFSKGLIEIHPQCKVLIKDLEAVEQEAKDFSKVKKNPKLTHMSDGMDYMIDYLNPISGTKPTAYNYRVR